MDEKTVLGPTLEIEGEIESGEDLVIQGSVNGKVVSKANLTVETTGRVEATVTTKNLSVGGKLVGNVDATDLVEVQKEGRMLGDIKAPRVRISEGARFKGNIDMGDFS